MDWPSEEAGNSATVFVRGLPYTWTDLDLSAHFEHIGPVRRSFIIHQKHTQTSKGFGFVQFALTDDANRAVDEMDGKEVGEGRRLRVEIAVERGKEGAGGKGKGKGGAGVGEKRKEQSKVDMADTKRQRVDTAATVNEEHKRPSEQHAEEEKEDAEVLKEQEDEEVEDADSETSEEEDEAEEQEEQRVTAVADQRATGKKAAAVTQTKPTTKNADIKQSTHGDEADMTDDTQHTPPTASPHTPSHALLVSGIPPSTMSLDDVLKQHSLHPTLVVFPAPESTLKRKAARLTFPSASLASQAASLLSSTTLPAASAPLRCVTLPINASRLIVRNLPFHIAEPQLRKLLSPYGAIASLVVPLKGEVSSEVKLNRGFGFVCYVRMEDAASMMAAVNGKLQWGRRLAVDWSLDKQQYDARVEMAAKKEKLKEGRKEKKRASNVGEGEEDESGMKVKKEEEDEDGDEDVVMVKEETDVADSSGSDMEEEEVQREKDEEDEENVESDSDEQGDDEKSSDDDTTPLSPASSTASSSASSTSPRIKPSRSTQSTDSDADCTLFIRNLAYDTTEQALFDKFTLFGPVKYARVVMERIEAAAAGSSATKPLKPEQDRTDGEEKDAMRLRSKGVAFVRFYRKADADRVLSLCQQSASTVAGNESDRRVMPSMVSLSESGVVLDNRQLNIVRAVDKRAANQFTTATAHKLDKRNLYLAREGVILPSSVGASSVMAEEELKRRERYYREKKRKLDNPNFMVSRVRLSLRNLPLECDDKQVKRTMMAAVKLGRKEERQREREDMQRITAAAASAADNDADKQQRRREAAIAREAVRRAAIVVRQVKVVRDSERAGAGGVGRSKRYGFIEFDSHETALTALRTVNAHSELWKEVGGVGGAGGGRVMVEFAVDDVRKVKEREERQKRLEKMREIKAKMLVDKAKAATDAAEATEATEAEAGESGVVTAKDRKRQAREAGVCYKCGEAGHQAKRCKKRKAATSTQVDGEAVDGVKGVKDEAMKEETTNGHSKGKGRNGAKTAKASKAAVNGHAAAGSKKRESSEVEQQAGTTTVQKATKKAKVMETAASVAVNGTATQVAAGKRQREERPQQQLSKREKRELAGEARFEAMVSEYKKKFLDTDPAVVSKDSGSGTGAPKGETEKPAPKSRWFDIDDV